jgi:anti-sigma-K factor RskA
MTRQEIDNRYVNLHSEVWALLPWYVNGTLTDQEIAAVEAHLATCADCQCELARCREITAAVRAEQPRWAPSPKHFDRLLTQIEVLEARQVQHPRGRRQWRFWVYSLRGWLQGTPRTVQWALAVQAALIVVLTGALFWPMESSPPLLYQTLTRPSEPRPADQMRLRVVFAEDITEKEIRALLNRIGATIVQGPSAVGIYTIELAPGIAPTGLGSALEALRADRNVRLAEPVANG